MTTATPLPWAVILNDAAQITIFERPAVHGAEDMAMTKRFLAAAAVLALLAGMATSAIASDRKSARAHITKHDGQHMRVRPAVDSGYRDLGPLGVMFGCGGRPCKADYSVSAWSY